MPLPPAQEISLDAFVSFANSPMMSNAPLTRSPRGVELDVDGSAFLLLPFPGAVEVDIDFVADGFMNVFWASEHGIGHPPWRYSALRGGPARLHLDMLETAKWNPGARPALMFDGSTHLAITRVLVRPPPSNPETLRAAYDRAAFWAPESIGHTTINFLTPPMWSVTDRIYLEDVLAAGTGITFLIILTGLRVARRQWHPGVALAFTAFVAVAASNAYFLLRLLPAANLSLPETSDARIHDNYYFAPEFGALAALARTSLSYDEAVGVIGAPDDWFTPQTMCLNLAPRRCVIVNSRKSVYTGISGVGRVSIDKLDAIVSFYAHDPLPPGFIPFAAVSRRAFISRRR